MYESSQKNHSSSSKRQQKQQQQLNGHTNGRIGSGRRVHVLDNNIYSQQHPSKMVVDHTCSSSPQQCDCCPYGYHIDLGFVKFAEDIAAGKEQIQAHFNFIFTKNQNF
uniref:Uncharacterized protein n=1 Tax=Meloidogyne enterolobii TaxID=390850 RepID=A0A6V7XS20_MELEN|nr:unnamed protein product [Meloidogyne enterolobii]